MRHASNLTFVTAAALSVIAWTSPTAALVCWLIVVLATNLLWRRSRTASRSLTIACVVSPVLWLLPPLAVLVAPAAALILLKLRNTASQRGVTARTSA